MSEHDVTRLLVRVAAHTPSLDVDVAGVVTVGRRRVRRRRVVAAGVTAAALVGAFWFGPGPGLLEAGEISPASVSWEVEEETTVTVLHGETTGGEVAPLTVTKGPQGTSATFVVDGVEQTVQGQTMEGGADVFAAEGATVMLWHPPPEAVESGLVVPTSSGQGGSGTVEVDGEDLAYWYTVGPYGAGPASYWPEDIVFHDDHQVWTASGQVAETVELGDGAFTGFELPHLPMTGVVNGEWLSEVGLSASSDGSMVARVPSEAAFARTVRLDGDGEGVETGAVVTTEALPSADLALFDSEDAYSSVQWSHDGVTWQDQDPDDPTEAAVDPGPVGPGGKVLLLDETYEVALDQEGWPELRQEDGTVFLTVTDEDGVVSDGGAVMWRAHWWPWSARHSVHFTVGEESLPTPQDGAILQDVVTIFGPSGEVTLGAVRAD